MSGDLRARLSLPGPMPPSLQKLSVLSRCPSCRQLRLIDRYSRSDFEWMLTSGNPIEGWCSLCDETWIFSEQDRAAARLALQIKPSSS